MLGKFDDTTWLQGTILSTHQFLTPVIKPEVLQSSMRLDEVHSGATSIWLFKDDDMSVARVETTASSDVPTLCAAVRGDERTTIVCRVKNGIRKTASTSFSDWI